MNKLFTSTFGLRDSRNLLVNNERINFIEEVNNVYKVYFVGGEVLELDGGSGKMLCEALKDLWRVTTAPYQTGPLRHLVRDTRRIRGAQ